MSWEAMQEEQPTVMSLLERSMNKDRVAHAYIFEGKAGAGKRETALLMAQRFFCVEKSGPAPCGECRECRRITHGNHSEVMFLQPEGASIKKAQVEMLQKEFTYKGMESRLKIYIIEDADRMTASAANSLLKFLEEPESPTLAILLTENAHFLLDTIQSRAQKIAFSPPSVERRRSLFQEREGTGEIAAGLLAKLPHVPGRENDAAQAEWIVQGRNLVIQLTEEVHQRLHSALLTLQDKWLVHFSDREELDIGLDMLLFWYRDLLSITYGSDDITYFDQKATLERVALRFSEMEVVARLQAILEAKRRLRANANAQLLMEQLLIQLQEGS